MNTRAGALSVMPLLLLAGCTGSDSEPTQSNNTAQTVSNAPSQSTTTHPVSVSTTANASTSAVSVDGDASSGLDGPVAAAVGFVEFKEELVAMSPDQASDAMRHIATPAAAGGLASSAAANIEAINTSAPAGLVLRVGVLETKVMSQTDTTAQVAVWATQITTGAGAVRATYSTITHDLELIDGRWLLAGVTQTTGPVPTQIQESTDPIRFESDLAGFTDLDMAES